MYAIHTTPGFIIESRPRGEAGKLLSIFTRDLGLVLASAQGIRLEKSKLRYHSQEYSFGEFSFVRGKEFWRLTNANELPALKSGDSLTRGVGDSLSQNDQKLVTFSEEGIGSRHTATGREIISRVALLLRRLLHGEEAHSELFNEIELMARFLYTNRSLSIDQAHTGESLAVFRILKLLGYVGTDKGIDEKFSNEPFSITLIDEAVVHRKTVNMHINKALKESHL